MTTSTTTRGVRLLRVSDFCRPRNPPKCQVTIRIVTHIRRQSCRRNSSNKGDHVDVEATVYVSADLLVSLSIRDGDVAWLSRQKGPSLHAVFSGAPVVVCARSGAESTTVEVPPTIAASIGFFHAIADDPYYWLQAYHPKQVMKASMVVVQPLGHPVPPGVVLHSTQTTIGYLPLNSKCRLLAKSSLVSILDPRDGQLYIFQVVNATGPTEVDAIADSACAFVTSEQTQWKLEPLPRGSPTRRLPPLFETLRFHESVQRSPNDEPSVMRAEVNPTLEQQPPHPSVKEVLRAIILPGSVPPQQRILHVVGTEENDTHVCLQVAAHQLGMRYLRIEGLAAYAHASGIHVVSTGSMADQLAGCRQAMQQAQACRPCVLHLVDFNHELSCSDEPMRHVQEQRYWTAFINALSHDSYDKQDNGDVSFQRSMCWAPSVLVVLSTTHSLATGPLSRNLVFPSITIRPPDEAYARYLWGGDTPSFDRLSSHLLGRSARDILFLKRLWHHGRDAASHRHDDDDSFMTCLAERLDAQQQQRSQSSVTHIPSVHWQDVGGLSHVRNEIMDAIELPLLHPNLFPFSGGRSGILLYGPPGTGKTLVAKAVATECGLPFMSVKGPELLGSYVGESEANVRATFSAARQAALKGRGRVHATRPAAAVLFFDELDSLAPRRGGLGDGGGVMERVVATLLTELDGRTSSDDKCIVFTIGATNRPDLLDPSLLRPGRLDRLVYLGLATSSKDRAQILAALIRKFRLEPCDPLQVAQQVVDQMPSHLSGADFSAIASGALMKSLQRVCQTADEEVKRRQGEENEANVNLDTVLDSWDEDQLSPVVTPEDLIEASKHVVPSVSAHELAKYERLKAQFQ